MARERRPPEEGPAQARSKKGRRYSLEPTLTFHCRIPSYDGSFEVLSLGGIRWISTLRRASARAAGSAAVPLRALHRACRSPTSWLACAIESTLAILTG